MDPQKPSNPQGERILLRGEVRRLRTENEQQSDEINALKSEAKSYKNQLERLRNQVLQETLAKEIGEQVRFRYLERHRQRMLRDSEMGRGIGKLGYDRIRCGDRAAHRGRPVVDALLCLDGLRTDREVYEDLYGEIPEHMLKIKDIPNIVEIAGFHASLQSEGRMTKDFKALFERFSKATKTYASPMELKQAFSEGSPDKILQQLQTELQDRYDKIVAANPRGQQQNSSSQQNC